MDLSRYHAQWVELARIDLDNKLFQFRKDITPASVAELGKSLAADGQKIPVVLWARQEQWGNPSTSSGQGPSAGSGQGLQLICGYRRVTAVKQLGWEKVLAIVIPEADPSDPLRAGMSEAEALRYNFIENLERKTLGNLDMMFACKKLRDKGTKLDEIARLIGKDERTVRRYIGITELPQEEQDKIKAGETAIRNAGAGETGTRAGSDIKNKNMYVKPTRSGFYAVLKYDRKRDDAAQALAFVAELEKQIKGQAKLSQKETAKKARSAAKHQPPSPPASSAGTQSSLAGGEDELTAGTQGAPQERAEQLQQLREIAGKMNAGASFGEVLSAGAVPGMAAGDFQAAVEVLKQSMNMPGLSEEDKATLNERIKQMQALAESAKQSKPQ